MDPWNILVDSSWFQDVSAVFSKSSFNFNPKYQTASLIWKRNWVDLELKVESTLGVDCEWVGGEVGLMLPQYYPIHSKISTSRDQM